MTQFTLSTHFLADARNCQSSTERKVVSVSIKGVSPRRWRCSGRCLPEQPLFLSSAEIGLAVVPSQELRAAWTSSPLAAAAAVVAIATDANAPEELGQRSACVNVGVGDVATAEEHNVSEDKENSDVHAAAGEVEDDASKVTIPLNLRVE